MPQDSKERFTKHVDNYVKYRPGYPAEAMDCLLRECGLAAGCAVADIGAGTGKFTRGLLERGLTVCAVAVDAAWSTLFDRVYEVEDKNAYIKYPKDRHLENIQASGQFAYAREIVFANTEQAGAERCYGLAMSQSRLQQVLRADPALVESELTAFRTAVNQHFGDQALPIEFCYRLRLGVADTGE